MYKSLFHFTTLSTMCLSIFFGSCNTPKETNDAPVIISVNSQTSDRKIKMSELYSALEYIKLETAPESLIAQVSKIIPLDTQLLIVDKESSKILLFDVNGKFMGTIGSKGVGAGEFIEIEDVAVDKKGEKIFVLDHSGKRILIYDLKGNFANDIKTDFIAHEIEYLENGNLACYCDYSANETYEKNETRPNLILLDLNSIEAHPFLYVPQSISVQEVNSPFSALFSHTSRHAFLFDILTNSIYEIGKERINRTFVLNFGNEETANQKSYVRKLEEEQLIAERIMPGASDSPQYPIITSLISCNAFLFLNAIDYSTMDVYQIAYSVDNAKCIYGKARKQFPIENDIDGVVPFAPYAASQSKIYGVIESYQLAASELTNSKVATILADIEEDDNPIIVIADTKKID